MYADQKNLLQWRDLPVLLLVVPVVLLLSIPVLIWMLIQTVFYACILVTVWLFWLPKGKDILVIYSNSPHWQEFFETALIPMLSDRSHILNWSQRKQWSALSLKTLVFNGFSGSYEFNPQVILFKPGQWPKRFRFYKAFRDLKHRNQASVRRVIDQLKAQTKIEVPYPPLPPRPSA